MLSMTKVSAGMAGSYYKKDDYYLQEGIGEWQGKLADKLGLDLNIKENDFSALINGKDPNGNFSIKSGGHENKHLAGTDLTFSAPKSVSVAGLVLGDKNVIEAHKDAVQKSLSYMEDNLINVRQKLDGNKVEIHQTDNMLAGKFLHVTSREHDPQLHTHCLIMNMSQNANGDHRAIHYGDLYDNKMNMGQIYRNELAKNLMDLGYSIKTDSKGFFEIDGIDPKILDNFSKRSEQIKNSLDDLRVMYPNLSEPQLKEMAALDSRSSKEVKTYEELKGKWDKELQGIGIDKNDLKEQIANTVKQEKTYENVEYLIKDTINLVTDKEASFSKEAFFSIASKLSLGEYGLADIKTGFEKHNEIIQLKNGQFTTLEMKNKEHGIVNAVLDTKNTTSAIMNSSLDINCNIKNYEIKKGFELTSDQVNAVSHILSSKDKIIAIQGDAGTGKTTMLDALRTSLSDKDITLHGMSFTGKAASEIEDASGIQSSTLASFMNQDLDETKNKMFIIDEASMLSIHDMDKLLKKADDKTKIVLIGDTKQLQSIGAGKIFSSLQEKNAIDTVRMSQTQRQVTEDYKSIVKDIADKKMHEAYEKIDKSGKIHEIHDKDKRTDKIAQEYTKNPHNTIVVTTSNKDRRELNTKIRDLLKSEGVIKKSGEKLTLREDKNLSDVDKRFSHGYDIGNLVINTKEGVLGKLGQEGKVINVDEKNHKITVELSNKEIKTIDIRKHGDKLGVFKEVVTEITKGEKLVFLKNDKGLNVKNGQTGWVKGISSNGQLEVKMENGQEKIINTKTQYNYLAHGYAVTDYKSQGQTSKHVIYNANTQTKLNYNQAYVAITRGKESMQIFTDSKENFREKILVQQAKTTTLDNTKIQSIEKPDTAIKNNNEQILSMEMSKSGRS